MCDCEGLRDDKRADNIQASTLQKHILRVQKHSLIYTIVSQCKYSSKYQLSVN